MDLLSSLFNFTNCCSKKS